MKDMKKYIALLLALMMITMTAAACSKTGENASEEVTQPEDTPVENLIDPNAEIFYQPEGNGIAFEEEYEDAEIEIVESEPSAYFGKWEATSDRAAYLYGSFVITVKEDGTWKATVSDEQLEGTWEDFKDHLHMDNEIFSFDLSFEKNGNLLLVETVTDDVFYSVLTKK